MKQTVYCDCFLCEYCENRICTVPILHLGQYRKCGEYRISQEKIDAHTNEGTARSGKKELYPPPEL